MIPYAALSKEEMQNELDAVRAELEKEKMKNLHLDMSRGKPGKDQLAISMEMLTNLKTIEDCFDNQIDSRNYGVLNGLPSARILFADLLDIKAEQVFVGGGASLQLMYDTIAKAYTHGLLHSPSPWSKRGIVRFLCPAPGYDRHFRISESFGMEMIPIAMTENGPDMDAVEEWIKDPNVVGMWCCPKYSNPDGVVYSAETIQRIASLRPSAPDFTIMWDNAYCVHEIEGARKQSRKRIRVSARSF